MRAGLGLLLRWVRGTEWRWFLDFASPAFFDVLPLRALTGAARGLVGNTRDVAGFRRACAATAHALQAREISLRIVPGDDPDFQEALPFAPEALAEPVRRRLGERVLEAYFAQLLHGDASLLDLRAGRVVPGPADAVLWAPRAAWVRWDPDFLAAVRDLYLGFYRNDEARFTRAVRALDLEAAAPLLRTQFGGDDQRAVRFATARFQATFHEIFVCCRDAGAVLHADFLPLGVALACLYDGLEALALPFDVRAAFERVDR